MAGRPKTSVSEKKLAGTLRADRFKEGIQFQKITEIPEAPKYLGALAKKYFSDISSMLINAGMLYNIDVHLIMQLANRMATYEEASNKLKTASSKVVQVGKGNYEQQSPWLGIRNDAEKAIREIGSLFGFDPLSRTRFAPPGGGDNKNPFGEFFNE